MYAHTDQLYAHTDQFVLSIECMHTHSMLNTFVLSVECFVLSIECLVLIVVCLVFRVLTVSCQKRFRGKLNCENAGAGFRVQGSGSRVCGLGVTSEPVMRKKANDTRNM